MILPSTFHQPVLLKEIIKGLNVQPGKVYIDATIGGGGYSKEILACGALVLGIDRDEDALEFVRSNLVSQNLYLAHSNFAKLDEIVRKFHLTEVYGIIFDLGISTFQLKYSGRGFSFNNDEPLDMRLDKESKVKAADIINSYSQEELNEIFTKNAEELYSGAIALAIVRARTIKGNIITTKDLVQIIDDTLKAKMSNRQKTITRIFQAIRIEVNNELENLKNGLVSAINILARDGRLCVISFHSLEDRIVKKIIKDSQNRGLLKNLTPKPIVADLAEIRQNPQARSAKLRLAQKL